MPYDFGMRFEKVLRLTKKHLLPFRQIQNLMNLMKHAGRSWDTIMIVSPNS